MMTKFALTNWQQSLPKGPLPITAYATLTFPTTDQLWMLRITFGFYSNPQKGVLTVIRPHFDSFNYAGLRPLRTCEKGLDKGVGSDVCSWPLDATGQPLSSC